MSNEGPKLYTTKPKKTKGGQLKQQHKAKTPLPASTPSTAATASTPSSSGGGIPPLNESFARRYKFVWPVLLTVNLAIGGYLFLRTSKKDKRVEDGEVVADVITTPVAERPITPSVTNPVKVREPIPEDRQRELFRWILEEKRKVVSKDPEEKKRNDEEKAILEHLIRGKSMPSL